MLFCSRVPSYCCGKLIQRPASVLLSTSKGCSVRAPPNYIPAVQSVPLQGLQGRSWVICKSEQGKPGFGRVSLALDAACAATHLSREQRKMLNKHTGAKRALMLLLEMK